MTYGDEAVLFPVADLYDQGAMRMYIEAAKDLYDRGQKAIDDFIAKYGDFTSPILADVEYWDNNTMKPLIDMIDEFLRNGIDPARSREARNALMARARRLPYALLSAIKQNAEDARQFRAAQLKLIQEGKYNEAYRDYDGVDLNTFRTVGENGQINRIGNLSPTPIQDLTTFSNPFFQDVKPRVTKTTKNGITEESESLTHQDLLDLAALNYEAMAATPQGQIMHKYLVDQYISNGADPDEAESLAAEAFIKNVAASQERRLTDNKAYSDTKYHEFELQRNQDRRAENADRRAENADRRAERELNIKEYEAETDRIKANATAAKNQGAMALVFKYGEATQEAAIGRFIENTRGTVDKLKRDANGNFITDSKGRPVVETDKNGKPIQISVNDASVDEVMHAYYKHGFSEYKKFMNGLLKKYRDTYDKDDISSGLVGTKAFNEFLNKFGYIDTATGWAASMGKKVETDGTVKYSSADFDNLYTDAELLMMSKGYAKPHEDYNHYDEIKRDLKAKGYNPGDSDMNILTGSDGGGKIEPIAAGINSPNKVPVILKDGRMQLFRAVNINYGNSNQVRNTGRLWIPVGTPTLAPVTGKDSSGRTTMRFMPYNDEMDSIAQQEENALFSKAIGKQGDAATE